MTESKLVLLKSLRQRRLEGVVLSSLLLPIGPLLRHWGPSGHLFECAAASLILVTLLFSKASALAAPYFGGVWIPSPERIQRIREETLRIPAWQEGAAGGLGYGISVGAIYFLFYSLGEDKVFFAHWAVAALAITTLAAVVGFRTYAVRRQFVTIDLSPDPPPSHHFRSAILRNFPRVIVIWGCATVLGILIGEVVEKSAQFPIFLVAVIAAAAALQFVPLFRLTPRKLYVTASQCGFWQWIVDGIVSFGIPMAFMMNGIRYLEDGPRFDWILAMLIAGIATPIGGACFGALLYIVQRSSTRSAPQGSSQ